ncbi:site-specific integrase [soil metagenome]
MAITKVDTGLRNEKTRKPIIKYRVRVDAGITDKGKRYQRSRMVGSFEEATRLEADWKADAARGQTLVHKKQTVAELLDDWYEAKAGSGKVRPENMGNVEIIIRVHLKPALGHIQIQRLTVEDIERFYNRLEAQGKSTSLIRKCHTSLNSALKMAKRRKRISDNPCDYVDTPKMTTRPASVWTLEDVNRFLTAAEHDNLHPYWQLALDTGARTSELLGLTWSDVDLTKGTLTIGRQVVRLLKGTPVVKYGAKTTAGFRTIRLTRDSVEELRAYRTRWAEKKLRAAEWPEDGELVFCTASGKPINPQHVRRSFNRLVAESGVKKITPHGMRKTAITTLIASGIGPKGVAARVGHSDVTTTIKTYTALVPQMEDDIMDVLETLADRRKAALG